jgi:hypothetical protein
MPAGQLDVLLSGQGFFTRLLRPLFLDDCQELAYVSARVPVRPRV